MPRATVLMPSRDMKCPFCGSADTQVIDSRVSEAGDSIRRRRRCPACQKRFTTYETAELRLPQIVKQNGTRADFDVAPHAHRLPARAAQAAGADRVRRPGDRAHRAAGAGAGRARDSVAPGRRDGDAGAATSSTRSPTSASPRCTAASRTSTISATRSRKSSPRRRGASRAEPSPQAANRAVRSA